MGKFKIEMGDITTYAIDTETAYFLSVKGKNPVFVKNHLPIRILFSIMLYCISNSGCYNEEVIRSLFLQDEKGALCDVKRKDCQTTEHTD